MAHYSRLSKIVIDVPEADHDRELAFWSGATGQQQIRFDRHPEYHGAEPPGHDLGLLVQRLGDGPGRVHLDIHTDDPAAELARLEKLGAELVAQVRAWWIMRDPAGLLFCVIPEPPARSTTETPGAGTDPACRGGASGAFGAYGTVVPVPLDDLPDWLPAWCADHLGGEPAGVLFQLRQVSMVFGLRLAGGMDAVVKARADNGRAASCVAAQARLAERGFPCARPLTPVISVGSLAVHAEEYRPGGEVMDGDSPDMAVRCAAVFARLMAELAGVTVAPPLPNPLWVRWDHADSGVWPATGFLGSRDQSTVPPYVVGTAVRARGRLLAAALPCVLGHADFEAQNLRWHGPEVWAVHDWDSLAWQPEAALAGAASGAFASSGPPTLAPIESSEAFLVAYQDIRGHSFTAAEQEIAWAASVWMAAYNVWEALHGDTPLSGDALRAQAAERLRRANA